MTRVDLADFDNFYKNNLQSYLDIGIVPVKLGIIEANTDPLIVCYHDGLDYNEKYVKENNYATVDLHHQGGCVVSFKGDYMVFCFNENSDSFNENVLGIFAQRLQEILEEGHNVEFDDNDILVDGYKISGAMCTEFHDKMNFMGFFVSYHSNKDIIDNISTKPMIKEPKGLDEFGVKRVDIENLLVDIVENFKLMGESNNA